MAKKKSQLKKSAQQVNDSIQRASQYARSLIEASLDPLVTISADGKITDVNEATIKVTGILRRFIIGSDFSIYFTEPEKASEGYKQVFAKGFVADYPLTIRHQDGKLTEVLYNASVYKDGTGKVIGVFAAARDVTTQRKAEKEIAEQRAFELVRIEQVKTLERFRRMATVIQDSNDAITFQDLEGNILAWNKGAMLMYGYTEAEALRMNIVDTVPSDYEEEARGFLTSLKLGKLVPNLETKRKHKDGRILDVWLTNTKLTDDKGMLTGIATTERDISQRKLSESSIKDKFQELNFLREGQIALLEKMRGEQVITRLGQSILGHLVPFTNAQLGTFYVLFDDKKLQQVSCYAHSKMAAPEKFIEFGQGLIGQVALEKKSLLIEDVPSSYFRKIESSLGDLIPRSLLICPILYENEVIGVIELGSLHPFTDHQRSFLTHVSENIGIAINTSIVQKKIQKLLESLEHQKEILNERNEALNKAQRLLEEKANEVQRASQYKTEFLANMSHELRTPLNSSLILAKLLMNNPKENLTEEQVKFATSIYSTGNDLLDLINDILDLSKVEAGKLEIRIENVLIPNAMEALKKFFQPLAEEKKLRFEVISGADIPQSFLTDRQRLDQILKNLLSNAFKFTEKGSIEIRLYRHSGGEIAFEVRDSGIGIPKEQQKIIFEAFRQADGTRNRKYGGTGLGLSISRDLARLLGGSIEVKSTSGKGSCFTLILPRSYDEYVVLDAPAKAYSYTQGKDANLEQSTGKEKKLPLPILDDRNDLGKTSRTILVIEADIKFAKILLDFAHELKFKCLIGQGADEGFEMALEYNPDAILLDMKLPDHTGLTVLDRLKENPKTRHIPVHVMSIEDYSEVAFEMGAIGFMLRPCKGDEIKKAFEKLQAKFSQKINRVLIVENDELKRQSISRIIADEGIEIIAVALAKEAIIELKKNVFDCIIMNPTLPDISAGEFLEQMTSGDISSFPPVIVYAKNSISRAEEDDLRKCSKSIILKVARSPESLINEATLLLHRVESKMSLEHRQMLKTIRSSERVFVGRKILLVDDDIRNIFALTSVFEQKGATIVVSRNGHEALDKLEQDPKIDLVLMDIMMPEMDGYEATRRIRKQIRFAKLPIIAVTAKAMKDDQEKCLEAGTNDYLSKPVDLNKLLSLVRVWIPKKTISLNVPLL